MDADMNMQKFVHAINTFLHTLQPIPHIHHTLDKTYVGTSTVNSTPLDYPHNNYYTLTSTKGHDTLPMLQ